MSFRLLNKISAVALSTTLISNAALAERLSVGMCESQGNWLQTALNQADAITSAIQTLRNDENCKLLTDVLTNEKGVAATEHAQGIDSPEITSYANFYNELSSIKEFLRPTPINTGGMAKPDFQKIVYNVVFNKSFDAIKNLGSQGEFAGLPVEQQDSIKKASFRLKNFLQKSKDIANMTMKTTQKILDVLPQSQLCLHNRPSTALAFFAAFTHASAALASGGEINGLGEFLGKLMHYTHDMKYVKALVPMEMARFNASVSCLVESTSESYCALQDAEDSLDFIKGNLTETKNKMVESTIANSDLDPISNPLGGLIIYMRDIPITQKWMQRVLFGIDPRRSVEAQVKTEYWGSFVDFIRTITTLPANFAERERLYRDQANLSQEGKLAQVKMILEGVVSDIIGGPNQNSGNNFFTLNREPSTLAFYLMNVSPPLEFNRQNDFTSYWSKWSQAKSNGLANPDQLLETIRARTQALVAEAKVTANVFFAKNMIVDPQNLLTEAFAGPGVSPFQAFIHLRNYYANLTKKLERSALALSDSPQMEIRKFQLLGQIPMLKDSVARLDKVIDALKSVSKMKMTNIEASGPASQQYMNIVYEAGNMLISRDSLFGTRMQTALQADLTDTLISQRALTGHQSQLLASLGSDIVMKLSGYFAIDPITQRTDVAQAKAIHIENLRSVESLFSKVLFKQIVELDCKIMGGYFCQIKDADIDPAKAGKFSGANFDAINQNIIQSRKAKTQFAGLLFSLINKINPAVEDAPALIDLRAKLCMQSLAFESRNLFKEVCRDAVLESEYSNQKDAFGLNISFNETLDAVNAIKSSQALRKIDNARGMGVCALRSYFRKNNVYRMYKDFLNAE